LLHVGDIAWSRVAKPADVLSLGQQVEVKVLKTAAEHEKRRISVGMKQLQPHPWDLAEENYKPGDRVRGTVTRVAEFGAFVEVASGIEGLIHVSEMSWTTKVRKASDLLAPGEMVETVVLSVNAGDRRMSLGLKQALGDPWREAAQKFPAGSVVEAEVISFTKFGAFVRLSDGLEGMIHVSDLSAEKHISHPQEVLRLGQPVKTQVLVLDAQKRQLRLGIKQLRPNNLDEYLAEHKEGDAVSGRIVEVSGPDLQVELGEGIHGGCRVAAPGAPPENQRSESGPDLLSLTSMLEARWKGRAAAGGRGAPDALRPGQVRNFRIARLDRVGKKIELELAQ
jgi:small subunit ribosomal protein S1